MKEFLFIYLKITKFTNYLTVVTNVLKLEVGEKTGHDRSGDLETSPKTYRIGDMGAEEWKPILEGRTESPNAEMCLWEGKWVRLRLTHRTVVWVLSSILSFQTFKYYS